MIEDDLQRRLPEFVDYRRTHLRGDEKGEAQVFLERLFQAFGHAGLREAGATLEDRLSASGRHTRFVDLMWKPRCLIEMKKAGTDLTTVYRQAFDYWVAAVPDRPRYVVLCNFDELWVYDFDQQLDFPMDKIQLAELPHRWEALTFLLPQEAAPTFRHNLVAVTRDAAARVARVFTRLVDRGVHRAAAQRFVLQCVMAMFSEDIGLLPRSYFTHSVRECLDRGGDPYDLVFGLFREMNTNGATPAGRFAGTPYFNGGLFTKIQPITLEPDDLAALDEAALQDWSYVRPEVFGTLFEGSMDEGERHATGAHFTSQADIMKVVGPTIVEPWRDRIASARNIAELEALLGDLFAYRVLDPACGSGNFLYVAYRELRRLEVDLLNAIDERRRSAAIRGQRAYAYVTPDHFYGMDTNAFAVEIAKVVMMLGKKLSADELDADQPVLPLDSLDTNIVAGDALFESWPRADAIIGNPPYLGRRKMVQELGAEYVQRLGRRHPHVAGVSDFVCHWFPLAHDHLPDGGRAGFVATNTIRENDSRVSSLDYIEDHGGTITNAVSSQPWTGDAAVHVSIINWYKGPLEGPHVLWLNNSALRLEVPKISTTLRPQVDLRHAQQLRVNMQPKVCFQGQTPGITSAFTLDQAQRDELVRANPRSALFVRPFIGGEDVLAGGPPSRYVIDLPHDDLLEAEFSAPGAVAHLRALVLPVKQAAADKQAAANITLSDGAGRNAHRARFLANWWQQAYRRRDMIAAIEPLDRYIALTIVAQEKRLSIYAFVDARIRPAATLQVFAFDDDYSLGILSSSIHRAWFEARCSTLETRLRYTPESVFNYFPWPQNPTASSVAEVAAAAAAIQQQRRVYLSRGASLKRVYDALREPGTNRLRDLHGDLDSAVYRAYGFSPEDPLLGQLLALNLDLADQPASEARGPGGHGLPGARTSGFKITG